MTRMTWAEAMKMAESITVIGEGRLADNPLKCFLVGENDLHWPSFEHGIAHATAMAEKKADGDDPIL